jgi:L-ascorbate metabolism protein UlaG (beta-lactamase superfamily)
MPKTAVTRITHSCHLIEIGGRTFLTDPWFSTRPGYYQGEPIAVGIADLPRLDGVMISHEHYATATWKRSAPTATSPSR